MLWFEIAATVAPDDVEAIAALMRDAAPGGVNIEEDVEILGPEEGFLVRADAPVVVKAYLPAGELGAVLTENLRTAVHAHYPEVELIARPLYEEDWAVSWREFFGVVDSGRRIVIVPSWVEHEPEPGQIAIQLDPGQAFGTGHHETTRLCLGALEDLIQPGMRVLDVGTGSGVLAIACVMLGAEHVDALDVDPIAKHVAGANCEANGVAGAVSITVGTLGGAPAQPYSLVVANISTEANISLATAFSGAVGRGGHLVLSGVLAADVARVRQAVEAHGFRLQRLSFERDWALLHLTHD
ncbi:MAG: 50S ribosomal protein L11 methyltransferase [Dehalococcoidia bacterium]